MLAWMSYFILVSFLLSVAALALEHSARIRQKPTRWLWGISMFASLLIPLAASLIPVRIPLLTDVVDSAIHRVVVSRDITGSELLPSDWVTATAKQVTVFPDLDRLLQVGWSATSMILLLGVLAGSAQLSRRRRHWKRGNMAGVPVYISEDDGPAIVGLLRPHIVVPRWLLQCSADIQQLVIAHEQSHLEAHDARLVTIALGVLICMPWNLPLWWQLRRLRLAIEIDCDARVLRRGYDISRYGEALIAVGERQSTTIAVVTAMVEPRSFLERRIRNMLRQKTKYADATAIALACLGVAFAVSAAEIGPPDNDGPRKSASWESRILDGYVGFYQVNDYAIFKITRDGSQLNAQFANQRSVPIVARSHTEFSYKDKIIRFIIGPDGQATSLILQQYGIDMPMKRIDTVTAQRIVSVWPERRYRTKPLERGVFVILHDNFRSDPQ